MKKTEIVGYKRANLGRSAANQLRAEGQVPCVLYGGKEQVSFYAPAYLFRPLTHTPDVFEVLLNIEGTEYTAILQATQFHPVNDMLVHADFLEITDDKVIKIKVPIRLTGTAVGLNQGGKLQHKLRKLTVKGAVKDIPEYVDVDVTALKLGQTVKVDVIELPGIEIIDPISNPVASVNIPRSARMAAQAGGDEDEDGEDAE
ncbi:50S ribosomal protein L25/general stress protein Ctc [Marinilongibacter aquaticus]|uniref:50S ribosomal protein L25/general stress protein Ctc n=1 Tax=Marinilongibacter aquaticus TaxID=2975157 RepID=UPI0021BDDF6C|nr:50S ribosomal protein L25/general stress protein Ctc [Marinilongibacter aquaticus]UBM58848.1 50S ribosomal protein L25/general stress protein Ctc [Marinilongibacter aquaticus]